MATSSRKLLTNYFEYIDKEKNNKEYVMKDKVKDKEYRLVEERDTNFFTNSVLNGIKFLPGLIENGIDFIYLDDYMLDENKFYNVIEAFSSLRNAYDDKFYVESLEKVVEAVLRDNELAREDDCYLILEVVRRLFPFEVGKTFANVMFNAKSKGISFESITRARRKIQKKYPELKNEEIAGIRDEEQKEYIEFSKEE